MITPKYIIKDKKVKRLRKSIRKIVSGTTEKPRMIVVRSNKFLYCQIIDDLQNKVLASASTLEKSVREGLKSAKDMEAAKTMGKFIAERALAAQVTQVVFDRNVYPYVGRVKAFADAAREHGLKF